MLFFYCPICKVIEQVSRYSHKILHAHRTEGEKEFKEILLEEVSYRQAEELVGRHTFKAMI